VRSKTIVFSFVLPFIFCTAGAQTILKLKADDGLEVVADKYFVSDTLPWILMFHQAGSSRGEFREIAPKLIMLGYNGLAVDLRVGKEINFINNQTALAAQTDGYPRNMQDARRDMKAAVDWVTGRSDKPVVLFGSSFSASLALIHANNNPAAGAVIAFSPGEFFGQADLVKKAVSNLEVPVFLASTYREHPYVEELSSGIAGEYKTLFTPAETSGTHGAKALWESEESSREYWLGLLMFFKHISELQIKK
jgi:pimeloyl-ACP methyl ester carboxylesterase